MVATASARGALPELQALLVEPTWREVLAAEFDKPGAKQLQQFLHREWAEHKVFPPQAEIFRCPRNASTCRQQQTFADIRHVTSAPTLSDGVRVVCLLYGTRVRAQSHEQLSI